MGCVGITGLLKYIESCHFILFRVGLFWFYRCSRAQPITILYFREVVSVYLQMALACWDYQVNLHLHLLFLGLGGMKIPQPFRGTG